MGFLDILDELLSDDEEFNPDFTIYNETGYDIHEIYVSESDNDEWNEDVLGDDILEDGASITIDFTTNSRKRYWDIRTIDEEEDETVFAHIDLSQVSSVTLFYDEDGEPRAECE